MNRERLVEDILYRAVHYFWQSRVIPVLYPCNLHSSMISNGTVLRIVRILWKLWKLWNLVKIYHAYLRVVFESGHSWTFWTPLDNKPNFVVELLGRVIVLRTDGARCSRLLATITIIASILFFIKTAAAHSFLAIAFLRYSIYPHRAILNNT